MRGRLVEPNFRVPSLIHDALMVKNDIRPHYLPGTSTPLLRSQPSGSSLSIFRVAHFS